VGAVNAWSDLTLIQAVEPVSGLLRAAEGLFMVTVAFTASISFSSAVGTPRRGNPGGDGCLDFWW
jgi:hypothetical protein